MTLDIVDDLVEAAQIANTETSALAAGIVAEDVEAVETLLLAVPGHRRLLAREHAVRGRLRADRHSRDGDQRRVGSRAREGPSPTATCGCASTGSSATARSIDEDRRQARLEPRRDVEGSRTPQPARRESDGGRSARRRRPLRLHRVLRRDRARRAAARLRAEAVDDAPASGCVGRRPGAAPAGLGAGVQPRRPPGGADPALTCRRRRPADVRQRLQHLRRAVPARGGPGRERERRDGHRRDHVRRQRRAGGAGRCSDARPAARAAHRGRRRLLARAGNAGGGVARRRLAHLRGPAGPRDRSRPRRHGEQDRGCGARRRAQAFRP